MAPDSNKHNNRRALHYLEEALPIVKSYLVLLRPSAHNRIAWLVVAAGVAIAATPIWTALIGSYLADTLGIPIPTASPWIGVTLVLGGLAYHLASAILSPLLSNDNESTKIREKNLSHDFKIVNELSKIIDETAIVTFCDMLMTEDTYLDSQFRKLSDVVHFASAEKNSLINKELEEKMASFVVKTRALQSFLSLNFFVYPRRQPQEADLRFALYPDLNVDRAGNGTPEQDEVYSRKQRELDQHTVEVRDAFRSLIQQLKSVFRDQFIEFSF